MKRRTSSRRLVAAFTLVELMVSVGLGGVAITAIYQIGSVSARNFQQQQQLATTQASLRFAMLQVKNDIQRAGYMSSARARNSGNMGARICGGTISNSLSSPYTTAATGYLAGVSMFDNDVAGTGTPSFDTAAVSGGLAANVDDGFTADQLRLIGNYETSREYPIKVGPATDVVDIDADWHGAQSDFSWNSDGTPSSRFEQTIAEQVFAPGSLVRIQTTNQRHHFAQIANAGGVTVDATTGDMRIRFTPALTSDCSSMIEGGTIAPLSVILYQAREAAGINAERRSGTQGVIAQLIREEMNPAAKSTAFTRFGVANIRHVLDYLVSFNLEFTMSTTTQIGLPDTYVIGNRTRVPSTVNTNPEQIRSVWVELAARTPSYDRSMPWSATNCDGLRCYQIASAGGTSMSDDFAARVRVLRSEVFVPNIAFEGY